MTVRHMRIFLAVYRCGGITSAAQQLHMTQPAVTRAIQELESYYGVKLFERMGRRLPVTEVGKRFYSQAVHIVDLFDNMETSLRNWDALGVLRILEAVRIVGLTETCRIYQASTSELYGRVEEVPQNENTPFHPYSPYAVAKQYGFWIVKEYRDAYNMFAVNGILFNHESERRGENFVTRKITLAAGRIACGIQDKLYLGNLDSKRDWGYAKDYVECMWLMLQHDKPEDFVIATGVQHTVREFTTLAFHYAGIELEWQGSGIHEKGINKADGKVVVEVSEAFYRPTDVVDLWGDPQKARTVLGWNPQKTSYEELCRLMAEHDLKLAKAEAVVLKETAE